MKPIAQSPVLVYDFSAQVDLDDWRIVDDGVMGGLSQGSYSLSEDGHGIFSGTVSLENYGGFSSVRHRMAPVGVANYTHVVIRLRGDGKDYQFRLKADRRDPQSYITTFSTSGDWEEVALPIADFYPSYRGRRLDMPNFEQDHIEEITFLIANKKAESFELYLDKITLK